MLFIVLFGMFWFWTLYTLSGGEAHLLAGPEGSMIMSMLFDPLVVQTLFVKNSPSLSVFYIIALTTTPFFVIFAASDQCASDIGSGYLRFLVPRCNRLEIYIARFIASVILVWFFYWVICIAAGSVAAAVEKNPSGEVFRYTATIGIALMVYILPFVALMSFCSVCVGSSALSIVIGLTFYLVVWGIIFAIGMSEPALAKKLAYLLPSITKGTLMEIDLKSVSFALLMSVVYTGIYGVLAWLVFSKRDI